MPRMLNPHPSPRSRDRVLADALLLKPKDRDAIAERLLESLEPDPDVVAAWTELAIRRMKEVDRGEVKLIPWSVARKRLMAKNKKP